MTVLINIRLFGAGCDRCVEAEKILTDYFERKKIKISLEKINDMKEMVKKGIIVTPAIELNGKLVFHGRIPKTRELDAWLLNYNNQQLIQNK